MSEAPESLWRGRPIILASQSEGRAQVLRNAGIPFIARPSRIDERAIDLTAPPASRAVRLAETKALDVGAHDPRELTLGADQTLTLDGENFHKATTIEEARRQLLNLRGRAHVLESAIAIANHGAIVFRHEARTTIVMRDFSDDALEAYLQAMGDRVLTTVGCYEIEGLGAQLIERIDGDLFTIIGLPLLPLLAYFRAAGRLRD